jgi:hypothetical protein
MAQFGPMATTVVINDLEFVTPLPTLGGLDTPYETVVMPGIAGANRINRFPVPPVAWGFLTTITDADGELPYRVGGIQPGGVIVGALSPAGPYREPTIGQIWPRTG